MVLFDAPMGDWERGDRGLTAVPGREKEFRDSLAKVIEYGNALGCDTVHLMAGVVGPGQHRWLRHVQIAGVPGRHEPTVGEINYPYLFDLLDELRYQGWVGCEYRPQADTWTGLSWAAKYGIRNSRALRAK